MKLKKIFLVLLLFFSTLLGLQFVINSNTVQAGVQNSNYQMIAHSYDWGPAIDQVVINTDQAVKSKDLNDQTFTVNSSNPYIESTPREVTKAYLSDAQGKTVKSNSSNYLTLDLKVAPDLTISDPFHYDNGATKLNTQTKVQFQITQQNPLYSSTNKKISNFAPTPKSTDVSYPETKDFSKNYSFNYNDKHFGSQTLQYTYYQAPTNNKHALIIWLHGQGEGGSDPNPISLEGNKVVALSQNKIQSHFQNGADVLVPQTRTFWLDTRINSYANQGAFGSEGMGDQLIDTSTYDGQIQRSRYEDSLTALIQSYLTSHPNIDRSRIYIGGCSNGGYMALRMMVKDPSKFSAAYISSEAYMDKNITDKQIDNIKDSSLWFIHAANDPIVDPQQTTVPTYKRLLAAGAKDVHFTYLDDVHDQTGQFKGSDGQPYQYLGHYSWVNLLDDYAAPEFDGTQTQTNGADTTMMSWLSTKTKTTTWK
ncbi:prolyl oligopeptidase family serine peptidase [Companilactobacillus sp.]|uniref:prolyl oligopeptidase family serine peptidase n=1 Tax=Companilactobacillus sp. TaxID=2767905 RepID=UPI0025BD5D11|nr:prolyl oligopeptidase family serine peptidase [Companilactobacillus sp.]MCH4009827.1 prolyl oligopeptidase family serine peptidase [Companilactobacillus sp.]MCH4052497.1 prolyl oligopeptidase family serine peptidase [Companilactobacillus sp.]MCH4077769.1 prolyl oligopeptidase family serine peptidase [Companilactobacillus sp.]MCH4126345.1 prolyl oligopeptidase family serine peptidase [Companilactobacillus sp.]MCI1312053.1 prolyl oligopeptidase family serine peptidase [Companilactobacillus sp